MRGRQEERIKRVSQADRKKIQLSTKLNRFWRKREELREQARVGPGCCVHCGSEPCGGSWGPLLGEESGKCCSRCNHTAVEGWRPSHILWYDKKAFFVVEVPVGKAGSVYLRQDGVAWFMRIGEHHYFLGRQLASVDVARFKVSDPNGWPEGVKASDMGIGDDDVDDELEEASLEEFEDDEAPEDETEDEDEDEGDEDEDDEYEDEEYEDEKDETDEDDGEAE